MIRRHLDHAAARLRTAVHDLHDDDRGDVPGWVLITLMTAGLVVVIWALVQYQNLIGNLLIVAGVAMLGYTLYEASKLPREARQRIYAIIFLIALNPIFWGFYEQAGGSLNLYTDRFVDRSGVPAALFQAINPIYIILLGPIFAGGWQWLAKRGREPSTPAKFGLGIVQVGLGFLVLAARAARIVMGGASGPGLIPVLQSTGMAELAWAALVAAALVVTG